MGSKSFWLDAIERCVRTIAQTAVALITAGQVAWDVDWQQVLGVSATAGLISVLTSVASSARGGTLSPASALKED
jgi:ABC-type lipoprotein release transport system permease subunit